MKEETKKQIIFQLRYLDGIAIARKRDDTLLSEHLQGISEAIRIHMDYEEYDDK